MAKINAGSPMQGGDGKPMKKVTMAEFEAMVKELTEKAEKEKENNNE